MPLSVLVTADVHLGRASAEAPVTLPADRLRVRHAWERLVGMALERRVDALIVAGDLIDSANRRWEAMGPLIRDLHRLGGAGVRTIAVAGNHDWDTLHRLAAAVDTEACRFSLLGTRGWERVVLDGSGERLTIDGWSFPQERVSEDPAAAHHFQPIAGVPALGVLHADLDAPSSPYAPVRTRSLEARPLDGWILGHLHRPSLSRLSRGFVLYPGSPQAMDFGESGHHGAWLVAVERGQVVHPTFIPLSSMRYERLDIDLSSATDAGQAEHLSLSALSDLERRCEAESGEALEGVSVRVRLVGRSRAGTAELRSQLGEWQGASRLAVRVTEVLDCVLPEVDLEVLARDGSGSPLSTTARLLLALEQSDDGAGTEADVPTILDDVARRLAEVDAQPDYTLLEKTSLDQVAFPRSSGRNGDAPGNDASREALAWALRRVLASLLHQEAA